MFGHSVPDSAVVKELFGLVKVPLAALGARAILSDIYDKTYNIFDHDLAERRDPLSRLGYHPKEDYMKDSLEFQYMLRYKNARVNSVMGVDFKVFMGQTKASADEMLRICQLDMTKPRPPGMADLERELTR